MKAVENNFQNLLNTIVTVNEFEPREVIDVLFECFYWSENFQNILNESTFNISKDVQRIWNNYFQPLLNDYKKNPSKYHFSLNSKKIIFNKFSTNILKDEDCIKSDKILPMTVNIGLFINNSIDFENKEINIGLPIKVIKELGFLGISNKNYKKFEHYISPKSLQASIAHELSHWIDECLNNKRISNDFLNYQKRNNKEVLNLTSDFEIQAIVHSIKEIKNSYSQNEWDNLEFNDLLNIKPQVKNVIEEINKLDKKTIETWTKKFLKRLYRENLLSLKMLENFKTSTEI